MAAKRNPIDIILRLMDRVSGPADRMKSHLKDATASADKMRGALDSVSAAGKKMALAGVAIGAGLVAGVAHAGTFETAMAEVSTLVDTSTVDMAALGQSVRAMSSQFGSMPVDTAKGFYQTISSGFADTEAAAQVMTAGIKLAKGGVTDTFTAVDGLTSVLNAYGLSAGDSATVSDSLFTAMAAGKTTIGELASSLGQVAPIAAATGVALDEMNATVAVLTKGGLKTPEAVTALKGALSSVLKPSKEATDLAESLGIEFNTAAIKAMGFAPWLADVAAKTGMSDEKLASLFGSVEGLGAVLALGGKNAADYAATLEMMQSKAGATDTAFAKMDATSKAAFDKAKVDAAIALDLAMEGLLPAATSALNAVSGLARGFARFVEAHPALTKMIAVMAAVTAGVLVIGGTALMAAAMFGHGMLFMTTGLMKLPGATLDALQAWNHLAFAVRGTLIPALSRAATSAWAFAAAILANPITWIVVGIGLAIAQIYLLVKHFDKVKAWLQNVPQWAIFAFQAFMGPIGVVYGAAATLIKAWDKVKAFFAGLAAWWADSGRGLVDAFFGGIASAWNNGLARFSALLQRLRDFLTGSDAKVGPLSDITASGRAFTLTYAHAIEAEAPALEGAATRTTGRARPGIAPLGRRGGSIGSITINVNGGGAGAGRETERAMENIIRRYGLEVG